MINFSDDITSLTELIANLKTIAEGEIMQNTVAALLPIVHKRIHEDGKAADGGPISDKGYSNAYLKYRQKKFGRSSDSLVILSLTKEMGNDFTVITGGDITGLGFSNSENKKKAEWCEKFYGKPIYALTDSEDNTVSQLMEKAITDALH